MNAPLTLPGSVFPNTGRTFPSDRQVPASCKERDRKGPQFPRQTGWVFNEKNTSRKSARVVSTHDLVLESPPSLTLHPAAVYLSGLGSGSVRTMRQALNTMAALLTEGRCDAYTLDWGALRYQHTAALRSALAQKYAPTTANKMLAALRRVLKEANRLGLMSGEDYARAADVADIRVDPMLRGRALSGQEIAALMKACTDDPSPSGARDAAAIAILRGGLRRSEVVALVVKDFDPDTGALIVRQGKGGKDRIAYLPKLAIAAVNDWLRVRGPEPGALLCPVHCNTIRIRHLSDQSVLAILRKRQKAAGVEPFSPHDFRRTFISDLLDAGADIVTVQKLAGHANVTTTSKYDRRGEVAKRRAVDLLDMPYQGR